MKVYTVLIGTAIAISHVGYGMNEVDEQAYAIPKALPCENGVAVIVDDLLNQMGAQQIPTVLLEKHNEFLKILKNPTLGMETLMSELVAFQKAAMTTLKSRED